MNANPKLVSTPEAIALAATLIAQTKGDVAQARRSCTEALAWLQTVDPSYKPEPAPAPVVIQGDWPAERAELLSQRNDWQDRAAAFCKERDQARRESAKLQQVQGELDEWRDRALRAEKARACENVVDLPAVKPIPVQAAPAPAPAVKAAPAPAAAAVQAVSPAPAGLPPSMAAWLANRAKLEID